MAGHTLTATVNTYLENTELVLCIGALFFMRKNRILREYSYLALLLAVKVLASTIGLPILYLARHHAINSHLAYYIYFYSYWTLFAVQAVLWLMVIYSMYRLAMAPLKGLQKLGMLVFRWAAAISAVITIAMAFAPHESTATLVQNAIRQLQQTSSMLTLCLLLFVTFAIRPMGLSYRSRIFGISLGMGLLATANLVFAAWFAGNAHFGGSLDLANAICTTVVMSLWLTYFVLPEPERHIIVLPTTSPFLRWNQISLALGGNPGFVAVGSVAPSAFAGAELEMMRRSAVIKVPEVSRDMSIAV